MLNFVYLPFDKDETIYHPFLLSNQGISFGALVDYLGKILSLVFIGFVCAWHVPKFRDHFVKVTAAWVLFAFDFWATYNDPYRIYTVTHNIWIPISYSMYFGLCLIFIFARGYIQDDSNG